MMVERHYDDETLLGFLAEGRSAADEHLTACPPCHEKLESFRTITGILHEHDVWDRAEVRPAPVPATIASLRAFADHMAFEDAAAATILPQLLAGTREEWMPRLMAHPEWRTAGVVRRLSAEMPRVVMTVPPDAVAMTELATEIADHLDPATSRHDTIARLSGASWRDRAYALFYVGRFAESLTAADRADRAFRACVVDEYDRARVAVIRALSLRATEKVDAALAEVAFGAETFRQFEDATRLGSARLAEVHLLFTREQYDAARVLLESLEAQVRTTAEADLHARVLGNLGYCYWKLGRLDDAIRHHEASARIHGEIGTLTEAVRIRWNIAVILASAGRVDEALSRFIEIKTSFDDLKMTSEAALVSLDMAELLAARNDFAGVEEICRAAMKSFEVAGISYTARALTALAYIREAAQARSATPVLVKHVREYLRRLPQDGELLFLPPPAEAFLAPR